MTNEERKARIIELQKTIDPLTRELNKLKRECPHEIKETKWESAECHVCGGYFEWYCPDSPNHLCDYTQEDGSYDEDFCRYCGQPEERK
jgi:hypothetical protein